MFKIEYWISELAELSGLTTRTLRHYDKIGLLSPKKVDNNGYRIYGEEEIDLLQQIMFYRELEMPLDEIKNIISSKNYDCEESLKDHLSDLKIKKNRIETLIANVERTLAARKGEIVMSDKDKFEGFKKKMIKENEEKYGNEIRERYGEDTVEKSNAALLGMSQKEYDRLQKLTGEFEQALREAVKEGKHDGEKAQRACQLHKEWLGFHWSDYSKEAHLGLVQMYVDDQRFKNHYDSICEGAAEFLLESMKVFCR